jgi:hypothetical protein
MQFQFHQFRSDQLKLSAGINVMEALQMHSPGAALLPFLW